MPVQDLAVVASDLHLEDQSYADRPVRGDSYFAWRQIVDGVLRRDVGHVLLLGDIVNRPNNPDGPIRELLAGLNDLDAAGVRTDYILGQHDGRCHWPRLTGEAFPMHRRLVDVGGALVYGLDYQLAGALQKELDEVPASADVLAAHQVWADFMGDVAAPQGAFADVPVVSVVLTGDYHKCLSLKTRGKGGQRLTAYSLGSTCMQEISEPPEKYFGVLGDDLKLRKVRLRSRPKIEGPTLLDEESLSAFVAEVPSLLAKAHDENADLPDEVRTPLLRFSYAHTLPDAPRRVRKAAAGRAVVFDKEVPPEPASRVFAASKEAVLTLEGCLPLLVNRKREPDLYELSLAALQADDPEAALRAWARRYETGAGDRPEAL